MKDQFTRIIENYKEKIDERLENDNEERVSPMFSTTNISYEFSDKISAIHCGGIGVVDQLIKQLKIPELINSNIHLLKKHKPYFESDHILNIAYNIICGGRCLEDIELLRNNIVYMDALGAKRIPDPTTSGDFLRRFDESDIRKLMDISNTVNKSIWNVSLEKGSRQSGIIDIDGTIQGSYGEKKEGIDISYKGIWGFSPLVLTEATTGTHLYVVNRSGNSKSSDGAAEWIDKAIEEVGYSFEHVYLRGDTDFSLTREFDKWTEKNVRFVFGYSNWPNLVKKADLIDKNEWKRLSKSKKRVKTKKRKKKKNIKREAVIRRNFKDYREKELYVGEFNYKPVKCGRKYRVVVLKKIIDVTEGQQFLFEDCRYFFYITNIWDISAKDIVKFINGRCNHENKIEQLDNGIHALKMPASEFSANWAYMTICSLAWNIKSWLGLLMPDKMKGEKIIRCEFKRFQNIIINIPCQIIKTGRRVVYRFLNYNNWVEYLYDTFLRLKKLKFTCS